MRIGMSSINMENCWWLQQKVDTTFLWYWWSA